MSRFLILDPTLLDELEQSLSGPQFSEVRKILPNPATTGDKLLRCEIELVQTALGETAETDLLLPCTLILQGTEGDYFGIGAAFSATEVRLHLWQATRFVFLGNHEQSQGEDGNGHPPPSKPSLTEMLEYHSSRLTSVPLIQTILSNEMGYQILFSESDLQKFSKTVEALLSQHKEQKGDQ